MLEKLSFSKKIMFIFGFTSFVVILGIGMTTYFMVKKILDNRINDELDLTTVSTYNLIENSINTSVENYLRAIAEKSRDMVEDFYSLYKDGKISKEEAYRRTEKFILNNPKYDKIGKTGYLAGVNNKGVLEIHPHSQGVDAIEFKFMQEAVKRRNGYIEYDWKNLNETEARRKAGWMSYFSPWELIIWASSYKSEFIGLIDFKTIKKKISDIKLGKRGYIYVIDSKGKLIVHPELEGQNAYYYEDHAAPGRHFIQDIISGAIKNGKGKIIYFWKNPREEKAREKIVVYRYLEALDWIICSSFYFDDLYEHGKNLRNIIIFISIITLTLIALFSVFIGNSVSKPIARLVKGAEAIGKGDLDVKIPTASEDEIGYLSRSFNEMAENLKATKEEIEKAMKKVAKANQTKNIFLANMSHEIRTPLTSILGHTELLLPLISDERKRDSLENIKSSCKTLKEFIDNTLYMSKIEAEKLIINIESVNLYSILNEIRGNFYSQVNQKHLEYLEEIQVDIPQYVELDKLRLKQILINLINNAIKYTVEGYVKLIVKMESNAVDKSKIDLIVAVEDTGIGISNEDQQKLFKPFERLEDGGREKYDGAGLGLAISKKIVKLMGGEILVKSKIGEGSAFTFVLKNVIVSPNQIGTINGEDFDYSTIVFEKQKLLIVDDKEDTRKIIRGYLENTNIQMFEAEEGQEALRISKKHKPDVVLMDLAMPGMDGIEATKEIRKDEMLKDIPVLAFTASKTAPYDVEKYKKLFDRYLFKPISKAKLLFELTHFLKTEVVTEKREEPGQIETEDIGPLELSLENRKMIPEIIKELDEYRELWKSACKSNNFNEFKSFGLKIKELGDKHSVDVLSDYGNKIILFVENSKIKKIKSLLKIYPDFIDKLKS